MKFSVPKFSHHSGISQKSFTNNRCIITKVFMTPLGCLAVELKRANSESNLKSCLPLEMKKRFLSVCLLFWQKLMTTISRTNDRDCKKQNKKFFFFPRKESFARLSKWRRKSWKNGKEGRWPLTAGAEAFIWPRFSTKSRDHHRNRRIGPYPRASLSARILIFTRNLRKRKSRNPLWDKGRHR